MPLKKLNTTFVCALMMSVSKVGCRSAHTVALKNSPLGIMMRSMSAVKKQTTKMRMKIAEYLKSLIKADTLDSSKSFALVLSSLVGALIGLCVCFCLIWDVCTNGYLKTELDALGLFMLCIGGFMAGGGINKALSEKRNNRDKPINKEG